MRGTFRGVVHGEFETAPHIPVIPVGVVVLAAAFLSWLATVLLLLAVAAAVLAVLLLAACWLLRPRSDRDAELLAERTAAMHAEMAARTAPRVVENHYHLYLPPGADASGVNWAALPTGDAAEITREEQ